MELLQEIMEWIFGIALFVNALLFIPQSVRILKTKSTEGVSLLTFSGFLVIQLAILAHGFIHHDYILVIGYLLSIITCSAVVLSTLYYRKFNNKDSTNTLVFEEMLKQFPGHIYWKDSKGILLGCNTLLLKHLNLNSLADYQGKTDHDFFPKEQADKIFQTDQEIIKTGKIGIIEEESTVANTLRHYLSHKTPLKNKNNEIIGILGVSLDITAIKKETLERLEMLENIIALMPGHVYWVNEQGAYLGCNNNQAKSAGLNSRKEIIGKKNSDLPWNFNTGILPESLDKINMEVIRTGETMLLEEPAFLKDGTELIFLSNKVPIRNYTRNIIGMVGISIDITARKKVEKELLLEKTKAEAASNAKTAFLENMRHDIRTPLSGIVGLSELLRTETDKTKIQKFTASLVDASHELLRFLNEVLESIYVSSGEIPLLKKKFNLRNTLENVVKLHQPIATEKQLDLKLTIDEAIPNYLIGDPVRIYRIVLELLTNALKFTQKGHVKIFAKLAKKEDQNVVIKIIIEDTGMGVSIENQQDLFVRFKRVIPSYEGIYKGAGLGLSIVKQFLDDLKGEIYVNSQLDKGTKFVCIIPLNAPLLEETSFKDDIFSTDLKPIAPPTTINLENTEKRRVLVVEDQPIAALVAKMLLIEQGCEVDIAENGKKAIEQAQNNQYDFILLDIGLPDISGYEVSKSIRSFETNSEHKNNIIGLTGHIDLEKKQQGLDAGMDSILTKPLTQEITSNILKNFVPECDPVNA